MTVTIGYARPSADGETDAQITALTSAGCDQLFIDKPTPKAFAWRQLSKALRSLQADHVLVVDRLDRLGQNLVDIAAIAQRILTTGAHLRVLSPRFETTDPAARKVLEAIIAAQSEMMSDRAKAGIAKRRAQGNPIGPPTRLKPNQWPELKAMLAAKTPIADLVSHFDVSRQTLYNFRKRMEASEAGQAPESSAKS